MRKPPKSDSGSSSGKPALHPVYSVTNILNKVRMLDGTKITYSSWVKLFTLHAKGYKVSHHIDGTHPPANTDPNYAEWCEIDVHVLQWIYGSISEDLLLRVLESESTAYEAWTRLKNHFLNNKGARAAALEHEFTNLSLSKCASLDEYCQKLKDIGSQLTDVGSKVDDQRLVLQLVRGLPKEYDTVGDYVNQTLPNFETARSMLQLEEHRQSARTETSPAAALAAPAVTSSAAQGWGDNNNSHSGAPSNHNNGGNQNWNRNKSNYKGKGKGSGGNQYQRGGGNSGGSRPTTQAWVPTGPPQFWPMPWAVPPCPYPAQQGWVNPWQAQMRGPSPAQPRFSSAPPASGPTYAGQAYLAGDQLEPSQIGQAFQAMTLYQPEDNNFYMDTGASSHLTSESGMLSPTFNKSTIRSTYVGNGKTIRVHG
ncbi:uncharacterized protein LOC141630484 [Silene latifolia]|uniref:uncharacterized protein LOC141630484 n=1 Tax=Silene latifolia TaxID=37657 RepID=UPI003D76ED56